MDHTAFPFPMQVDDAKFAVFHLPLLACKILRGATHVQIESYSGWRKGGAVYRLFASNGVDLRDRSGDLAQPNALGEPFAELQHHPDGHISLGFSLANEFMPPQYEYDLTRVSYTVIPRFAEKRVDINVTSDYNKAARFYADQVIAEIGGPAPQPAFKPFVRSRYPQQYAYAYLQEQSQFSGANLSEQEAATVCQQYATRHQLELTPLLRELADRYVEAHNLDRRHAIG